MNLKELDIGPNNSNQILSKFYSMNTKEECFQKLRKYSKEKIDVVNQFFTFIENINDDNIKNI